MATSFKNQMRELMVMAWQFVKRNGYTMSEAMKVAWMNLKLRKAMKKGIVRFCFRKVDGTIREAFGTLKENLLPPTQGNTRNNPTIQTYYDTEKMAWRCFKVANLNSIG